MFSPHFDPAIGCAPRHGSRVRSGADMRLHLEGIIDTGVSLLDAGITDIAVAVVDGVIQVYSTTGRNGGIAGYELDANGQASVITTVIFPPEITLTVSDKLVFSDSPAGAVLYVGGNVQGLFGYAINGGGAADGMAQSGWSQLQALSNGGNFTISEALILLSEQAPALFPTDMDCSEVIDLVSININGALFVLTASAQSNEIRAFRVDPGTGMLTGTGSMGAAQGLGIDAPTAMSVAQVNGETFVIVAAAGTSSISVMRIAADGSLVPTDHVLDNGTTRFEGVQDLAVAQSGDHTFVVAGGGDNGITLFLLMPDGSLVHLQTIGDTDATSMHKVTSLEVVVDGDTLHVFVGSQNDAGMTHFTLDLSSLGDMQIGTATVETLTGGAGDDILVAVGQGDRLQGGAGADVLVAGQGQTTLTGGAGADTFVFHEGSGASTVTDFERGNDRLDLSDLPMLRDLSQLTFTTTASGAQIEFRGHVITLTSSDGRPLTMADVFPDGLAGGDHFGFYPDDTTDPPPDPIPDPDVVVPGDNGYDRPGQRPAEPGQNPFDLTPRDRVDPIDSTPGTSRQGGETGDVLDGTIGDDTLLGFGGRDVLNGGSGHDHIDGGWGHDLIYGGDGNDAIFGGDGKDSIYGGDGHDYIVGGVGRDLILGGDGHDTIIGGDLANQIWAGSGDDVVYATGGNNLVGLGSGDDWGRGGEGKDQFYGGTGSDTVFGAGGDDILGGGLGDDYVDGGSGNDTLFGKNGDDWLLGGDGNDIIWSGADNDVAYGGVGNDVVRGNDGNDTLYGDDGHDGIWGGRGDDLIFGGDGNDWLSGEEGNDFIYGGAGDDTLRGGFGTDQLTGGSGADVFEFFGNHDTGWIMDFDPSEGDILRLDDAIWASLGSLTAAQVVERFGSIDSLGNLVLDFADYGGAVIVLNGFDDLDGLVNSLEFM